MAETATKAKIIGNTNRKTVFPGIGSLHSVQAIVCVHRAIPLDSERITGQPEVTVAPLGFWKELTAIP
jgi:hypothetical protein